MASGIATLADGIRRLQTLNKEISEVALKEEILELRMMLMDVREELLEKTERIGELEEQLRLVKAGESCPICETGHLKVISSRPHEHFAFAGVQTRTLKCTECSHSENRMHAPSGITKGK